MAVESTKETQRVMHEMTSAVLDVRPMLRGSEKAVVESALGSQPGVERVEANRPRPVTSTSVSVETATTSYTIPERRATPSRSDTSGARRGGRCCEGPKATSARRA